MRYIEAAHAPGPGGCVGPLPEPFLSGCVGVGGMSAVEVVLGFAAHPFDRLGVESGDCGEVFEGAAGGESSADLVAEAVAPVDGVERRFPDGLELFELVPRQVIEHPFG